MADSEYAVYFVPWIVNNPPNWWASINIKNKSNFEQTVNITYENINGVVISKESIKISANVNHGWVIQDPQTRSITIEGTNDIFVSAFMGAGNVGENGGFTELNVRDITNLKN